MEKNVAGQKWTVFAFDRTNNTPKTGDAANITGKISIDGAAGGAITDTNPTEVEDGYYVFDLTQGETNGDMLCIMPESSTADIQVIGVPGAVFTRPANFNALGVESDGDVTKVNTLDGHTAQTGDNYARLGAPAGASVSADIASVKTDTGNIETDTQDIQTGVDNIEAKLPTNYIMGSSVQSDKDDDIDAILTDTAAMQPTVATNLDATVSSRSSHSAADAADAVWDEALSGHTGAGSAGKAVADIETDVAAILVDTGTTLPATLTTIEGKIDTVDTNVDSILVDTAEIGAAGAGLSAIPWNSSWDAEVQSECNDAIVANHLDHLFATAYDATSKPGAADALLNEMVEDDSGVTRYTSNALEQAPGGGGGTVDANVTQIGGDSISGNVATLTLKQLDIQNSAGSAVVAKSTGGGGHGIEALGEGAGSGARLEGGISGGDGLLAIGGDNGAATTAGAGIHAKNKTTNSGTTGNQGSAILAESDAQTGAGIAASASGSSNSGINCYSAVQAGIRTEGRWGINVIANNYEGIKVTGNLDAVKLVAGTNKSGLLLEGNGTGDGLTATGGASGKGINAAEVGAPSDLNGGGASIAGNTADIYSAISGLNDPTAADIADAVWDEAQADHTAAGTTGESLNDAGSGSSAADIADAVWDEAKAGHNNAGSFGEEVQLHSLSTELTPLATSAALAVVDSNVDSILADTADMQPKLGAPAGASISADIAAVKSDTAAILVDTGTTLPATLATLPTYTNLKNMLYKKNVTARHANDKPQTILVGPVGDQITVTTTQDSDGNTDTESYA